MDTKYLPGFKTFFLAALLSHGVFCNAAVTFTKLIPVEGTLTSAATDGTNFVAVGWMGKVLTSTNGVDWVDRSLSPDEHFRRVAYGGGQFAACTLSGKVYFSQDMIAWSESNIAHRPLLPIISIAWSDSRWLASAPAGTIYYKDSGQPGWIKAQTGVTNNLGDIIVSGDKLYAIGAEFTILESSDNGLNWQLKTSPYSGSERIIMSGVVHKGSFVLGGADLPQKSGGVIEQVIPKPLIWTGSTFVSLEETDIDYLVQGQMTPVLHVPIVVSNGRTVMLASRGRIGLSSDGKSWDFQQLENHDFSGAAMSLSRWIVVGNKTIAVSNDLTPAKVEISREKKVTVKGPPGIYDIEWTADLSGDWKTLDSVEISSEEAFVNLQESGSTIFLRAVLR
jgi:hypothetical protein